MEPEVKDIIFDTNLKQIQQEMKDTANVAKMMGKTFKENSTMNFSPEDTKIVERYKDTLEDMMKLSTSQGLKLTKVIDGFKLTSFADGTATIEKMGDAAEDTGEKVEQIGKKVEVSFKGGLRQLTRFTLGLIGIRSVWTILTRAANTYMNENKEIQGQLKITYSIFANLIGPAISAIINALEYATIIIAKVIQTLTGYNVLAKVSANVSKDLAKQAGKAAKALASFDTITNLTQPNDDEAYKGMLNAFNDYKDKVGEIEKFWNDWGTWVTAAASALGVLWGAKTLMGLGKLIGTASTATAAGTGLLGVSSLLSGLATFGAITISIFLLLKGYEKFLELKKFVEKWTPEYIDERTKAIKNTSDVIGYIKDNTKVIEENAALIGDDYNILTEFVGILTGEGKKALKTAKGIVEQTDKINNKVVDIIKNRKLDKDEAQKLLDYVVKQWQTNEKIQAQLELQGEDVSDINEAQDRLQETAFKIRDAYGVQNEYMWKIKTATGEIEGIKIGDKNFKINIDADPSSAERKTNTWLSGISNWFNGLGSKLSMFFTTGHLPHFDIGTNYVPQDTLAVVHKGEMIVPKKYNPMTSGIGGTNEETNMLLRQLNSTLENKQFNGYISASDITNTAINGINQQSRIMGRSVIK